MFVFEWVMSANLELEHKGKNHLSNTGNIYDLRLSTIFILTI